MSALIQFRPAEERDRAFVDETLLYGTMHQYVEEIWKNDLDAQLHYWTINRFNPANTSIIQLEEKDVGRLSTTNRADCIFIDELHILPEYKRRGIGRQAIERVFANARERHLPVRATILRVNYPSQLLCFSMGFRVFDFRDHRFHIVYEQSAKE